MSVVICATYLREFVWDIAGAIADGRAGHSIQAPQSIYDGTHEERRDQPQSFKE